MPRPTSHAACVDRPDLPHPRRLVALCTALVLLAVVLGPSRAADAIPIVAAVEAEHMGISPGAGGAFSDPTASGRAGLLLWSNGAARATLTAAAPVVGIAVTARGDQCQGMPMMEVRVDGRVVSAAGVSSTTSWGTRNIAVTLPAGARTVEVAFTNDHLTATCDRNLRIDRVALLLSSVLADNPVARLPLHVSRWTAAGAAADQIRVSRPVDAGRLDLLASTPTARWFGEWSGDVRAAVDRYVSEAATDRRLPVLVAYAIPQRDCSSYSGGGMTSAASYRAWIRELAAGIGTRPAVVILEPDAVALTHCLTSARRAERNALLADAIAVLAARPATAVYLDAGHSGWHPPDEIASRLRAAGVDGARGISLNVSNHRATTEEVTYARALHSRIGTRAVIDTGRNGNGPTNEWCNAAGRAIGPRPTTATADPAVDAYLWIKVPGESDGTCNGGPPAGGFWVDRALELVRNAE